MRIGIDIDGVLRDFNKSFMGVMKKHYPETMLVDKLTDWQLEKHFTLSKKQLQEIIKKIKFGKGPILLKIQISNESSYF